MKNEALEFHSKYPGKIALEVPVKCDNKEELSLAYTPGVALPCLEIEKNRDDIYKYTAKGNSVAVVTDGSAVLGLGNIGAEAGMPVMEGKAVLFKKFANIDAYPIGLYTQDVDEIVNIVKNIAVGFGGINLEDISAPRCFEIEHRLKHELDIPVFHDDQHGTAIVTLAGLIGALKLADKKISDCKIVFSGAGSAAMSIAKHLINYGANKKNIFMCDRHGVITTTRGDLDKYKKEFANETNEKTLADAMKGADVFIGVSVKGVVSQDMIKSMAKNPIVFAMANPEPEIMPELALEARGDIIMATGRSDYPNQINNVLGFPGIFKGALSVRATDINDEMKLAASLALASIVKDDLRKDYIIPSPFDEKVVPAVSTAVAQAAKESGVARI